jgi:hypothetical protein
LHIVAAACGFALSRDSNVSNKFHTTDSNMAQKFVFVTSPLFRSSNSVCLRWKKLKNVLSLKPELVNALESFGQLLESDDSEMTRGCFYATFQDENIAEKLKESWDGHPCAALSGTI